MPVKLQSRVIPDFLNSFLVIIPLNSRPHKFKAYRAKFVNSFRFNMTSEAEARVYKLEEVKEHNKSKGEDRSIWVVIHDKVYDITKFLDEVILFCFPHYFTNYVLCSIQEVKRF